MYQGGDLPQEAVDEIRKLRKAVEALPDELTDALLMAVSKVITRAVLGTALAWSLYGICRFLFK
jgi:hypothetical protein